MPDRCRVDFLPLDGLAFPRQVILKPAAPASLTENEHRLLLATVAKDLAWELAESSPIYASDAAGPVLQ